MDTALIEREYARRGHLISAISGAISYVLKPEDDMMKRGNFQRTILAVLGLRRTTQLCNFINDLMKENFRLVTIKGYQYYKRLR